MKLVPADILLPLLGYWATKKIGYILISIILSAMLASIGVILMKERFELRQQRYPESYLSAESRLGFLGDLRIIVAKEWLELNRSGSVFPAISGYSGQLLAIYFVPWLFQAGFGLSINFNVIFFSGFVGFMGVMTYSFLTNIEHNEYLNVQPISARVVPPLTIIEIASMMLPFVP